MRADDTVDEPEQGQPQPVSGVDDLPRRAFILAIAAITLSQGLAAFDAASVSTLARSIQLDLDTTLTNVQYGIAGQLLFAAAFTMVAARLGAVFGRTRILVIGLLIRLLGMLLTAASPNVFVFILGRGVLGGIGIALALVNGLAIIGMHFSARLRVKAASASAAVTGGGLILAPLVAGVCAVEFGWRWFYVISSVLLVITLALSVATPRVAATTRSEAIDIGGALLAVASFGCLVFGIQQITPWGLFQVRVAPFTVLGMSPAPFVILLGLILLAGFAAFEKTRQKMGRPVLFDLRLLRNGFVRRGNLAMMGFGAMLFGTAFLIPVYLQVVQGLTPIESSLRTFTYGCGALLLAILFSRFAHRFTLRGFFTITCALMTLGLIVLAWEISPLFWGATPVGMFLLGLSLSLTKAPLNIATQRALPPSEHGQLSAMSESSWYLGGALGVAIIGTILLTSLAIGLDRWVLEDSRMSPQAKAITQKYLDTNVAFVSEARVRTILTQEGLPPDQIDRLVTHYNRSANVALMLALAGSGLILLLSSVFVVRLPRTDPVFDPVPDST